MKLHRAVLVAGTETPIGVGTKGAARATVKIDGELLSCVVKELPVEAVLAEATSSLILGHWGLPTPTAAIIKEDSRWLFASVDSGYPNLMQRIGWSPNTPSAQANVLAQVGAAIACELPDVGKLLAADEAIANEDRNLHNILWDGQTHAYIDHEQTLGQVPHTNNKMVAVAQVAGRSDEIQKAAVAAALTISISEPMPFDIPENIDIADLIRYVERRMPSLASRVLARFPQPNDLFAGM